jgi:hypothetical protein
MRPTTHPQRNTYLRKKKGHKTDQVSSSFPFLLLPHASVFLPFSLLLTQWQEHAKEQEAPNVHIAVMEDERISDLQRDLQVPRHYCPEPRAIAHEHHQGSKHLKEKENGLVGLSPVDHVKADVTLMM